MAEQLDERKIAEKKKALENAIANIDKQFGKGAVMKLGDNVGMNVDVISTGALGLDLALGVGGLPRGRIIEIYGPESSGKTTVALHVIAEAQKNGGDAAFIDAEPRAGSRLCKGAWRRYRQFNRIPAGYRRTGA